MSGHLVLLGDSIFDNAIYVPDGPAVIDHVRRLAPSDWRATLVAQDGDVVDDVFGQVERVPQDATHLVISIGGNNALQATEVLSRPATNVGTAVDDLTEIRRDFQRGYRAMLWRVLSLDLPLAVCTIYDAVPGLSSQMQTALCIFNDTITREAMAMQVPVIDIRHLCHEAADYSEISPIEPSAQGGGKIARAIAGLLGWMPQPAH